MAVDPSPAETSEAAATDEGILSDLPAWCKRTGHAFLGVEKRGDEFFGYLKKAGS
jgi:TusA-related sulfurtransferase